MNRRQLLRFLPPVGLALTLILRAAGAPEPLAIGAFVFLAMALPFGVRRLQRTDGGADLLDRFAPMRSDPTGGAAAEARIADVIADLERNASNDRTADPEGCA